MTNGGGGDDDSQEAKEKDRDAAVKSNSSKAATVESANRYIRVLKDTDAAQKAAIAELQKAVDEMRARLGEGKKAGVPAEKTEGAVEGDAEEKVVSPEAMSDTEDLAEKAPVAAEAVK